jgi:hypothetical protein
MSPIHGPNGMELKGIITKPLLAFLSESLACSSTCYLIYISVKSFKYLIYCLLLRADHKSKKIQKQTQKLLRNMAIDGEMTRRHATIRRRIMEKCVEKGQDHVLKVFSIFQRCS